jgi:diguanylate cyclase (GGDEF)-like protein
LEIEFRYQKQGNQKWLLLRGKAVRGDDGKPLRLSGSITDISKRKEQERLLSDLEHKVLHDPLTELPNRLQLFDRTKLALTRGQREQIPFCILMIDLDKFKYINDTFGHQVGDETLIESARRLRRSLRDTDTIVRLGGDEFCVLLDGTEKTQTANIVEKIQKVFRTPFAIGKLVLSVQLSIGVAGYPEDGESVNTLLEMADHSMCHSKKAKQTSFETVKETKSLPALF